MVKKYNYLSGVNGAGGMFGGYVKEQNWLKESLLTLAAIVSIFAILFCLLWGLFGLAMICRGCGPILPWLK